MELEHSRIPVPAEVWFEREGLSLEPVCAPDTLRRVAAPASVIEDFRPVGSHLEWRLSEHYWATRGVLAFAENRVPYVVNNSGWLSMRVAELVFASCEAAPPSVACPSSSSAAAAPCSRSCYSTRSS